MNYTLKLQVHLQLILQMVQILKLFNAQTITFNGTTNQITHTISATDTITTALTPNVTISGNFTVLSGSGAHTLGKYLLMVAQLTSSGSTVTVDDDLSRLQARLLQIELNHLHKRIFFW